MKFRYYLLILFVIFGMQHSLEAGKIYHWVDKDGVQHFTNLPPPPGAQVVEGLSETPPQNSPSGTRPAERKEKRKTKGGKKGPAAPFDTGAEEGGQKGSVDSGDPEAVESGDRRFRKWKDEPNDREDTDAIGFGKIRPYDDRKAPDTSEGKEKTPTDREDPGAIQNDENSPSDRRLN